MRRLKKDPAGMPDFMSGIDIVAQTLDKVKADIVAQTITSLKADIVAQTIESLDMDIYAQTIGEVIQRPKLGATKYTSVSKDIPAQTTDTLVTVTGKGAFYYAWPYVLAATGSDQAAPDLWLDDNRAIGSVAYAGYNTYGFDKATLPVKLLNYGANSRCDAIFIHPTPLPFESSLVFKFTTGVGATITCNVRLAYALL